MSNKLNFQEKIQLFTKKQKKKTGRQAILGLFVTGFLIFTYVLFAGSSVAKVEDKDNEFTASFVGDMMFGRHVNDVIEERGTEYLFEKVQPIFNQSDYVSGNFENPVLLQKEENYEKLDKHIHLFARKESVQAVKDANFSVINLANNHMMDYGANALEETIDTFDKADLPHVGAGANVEEATDIEYSNINGIRVATVGFTDALVQGFSAHDFTAGVARATPENIVPTLQIANENADLVIANVHWGIEYNKNPSKRQEDMAHAISDAGADVIVGHHPHVLSDIELYNNANNEETVIFYSLGNFIFDQGWTRTKDSAVAQYHINKDGKKSVEIIPLRIKESQPYVTKNPYYRSKIFKQLTGKLDKDDYRKESGRLLIDLD